jgi:hypothetical protein
MLAPSTTEPDRELRQRAAKYPDFSCLSDLTSDVLRQVTADCGIDFATALLCDRLLNSDKHGTAIKRLDQLRQTQHQSVRSIPVTFAIAPGAFHEEFPHTGADGRLLRQEAERYGCRTAMIPVPSTGTLSGNAAVIRDWLDSQPDGKIILASVSKGGSDVKVALSMKNSAHAFRNVLAWINVCGILDGSPMVNWLHSKRLRMLCIRSLFWLRGYDFRVIRDLRRGPGSPLDFELQLPDHMKMITVVGFPLTEHMTNRLSRNFRNRIAPLGPNDGSVMLGDACHLPGHVYPVWGADHYMRPSWELRTLAAAILQFLAEELTLFDPAQNDDEVLPATST